MLAIQKQSHHPLNSHPPIQKANYSKFISSIPAHFDRLITIYALKSAVFTPKTLGDIDAKKLIYRT